MDMSNFEVANVDPVWLVTAGVLIVVAVALLVWALWARRRSSKRSERLQGRFQAEYERAAEADGRKQAERDLEHRLVRHRDVELVDVDASEADRYARAEEELRRSFVDDPRDAARGLTQAVLRVATARGYAALDDGVLDLISVDHPEPVAALRRSLDDLDSAQGGQVTEASRRVFLDARAVAECLLDDERPGRAAQAGPLTEDPAAPGHRADRGTAAGPRASDDAEDGGAATGGADPDDPDGPSVDDRADDASGDDEIPRWRAPDRGAAENAPVRAPVRGRRH